MRNLNWEQEEVNGKEFEFKADCTAVENGTPYSLWDVQVKWPGQLDDFAVTYYDVYAEDKTDAVEQAFNRFDQ